MKSARLPKYHSGNLIPMFRLAAALCKQMREAGFTDNGGAIHSAERIMDLLGQRLVYPELSHLNNLRTLATAEFSIAARAAFDNGEKVLIEHVAPLRDFTRLAISSIESMNDDQFSAFVREHFRLVLLTQDETSALNKHNRSKMNKDRLALAGIAMPSKQ